MKNFDYFGLKCPKLKDPPVPNGESLEANIEEYQSEELQTSQEVFVENGQLKLKHFRNGTLELSHAWGDDFSGSRYFINSVEFSRDQSENITGFLVSQGRARQQWFAKVKQISIDS